jgi:hypothetical protein
MLRGPAKRPPFAVPALLVLGLVITYIVRGRWLPLAAVAVVLILGQLWSRYGPAHPAGRVRRHWPWHGD